MKAAALQMVSTPRVGDNLAAAASLIAQAAAQGCELVVLPEFFCLMGRQDSDKLAAREEPGRGPIQSFLAAAAREHRIWLVGGTLPLRASDDVRVRNTSFAFSPQGECVARYDKIHLFWFDDGGERRDEPRSIEPGSEPVAFTLRARDGRDWRIGMSVCYDLRFPELYRRLQADVLLVPSAFTHVTGQAHWEALLRARAIENLAYVLAPAQGGTHENGRRTWGHTLAVDPWGQVIACRQEDGEGLVVADLDAERLTGWRRQLPALEHRVL
ncbi:carbon-nitrogen hydrolase family protein [Ramlibacter henchirensis]|uniref:Carbon-nitrogen hydrolase family protein n=1 Tax=Ramlibacter henchirensis TaxID=204072 RepID=A0A4Z0C9R2_9BURK|nr:carbon-nitrogen hydrolase family protein [Ramlibacter henchirensis]TFZ06855.1 carbon-nitrogen hydrolase family protein [Ramlibacter henchirensis]